MPPKIPGVSQGQKKAEKIHKVYLQEEKKHKRYPQSTSKKEKITKDTPDIPKRERKVQTF